MIGFDGSMNTGLTLRTAHIRNGVAAVRAGATLLFDSDPAGRGAGDRAEGARPARKRWPTGRRGRRDGTEPPRACWPRAPAGRAAQLPGRRSSRVLLVDHQDSFVHTLAGYFREQGADVTHAARRVCPWRPWTSSRPDLVVLSPGPGRPADFGCAQLLAAAGRCGTCLSSASAWACRRWWSTRAASWRCSASPFTASQAPCCEPGSDGRGPGAGQPATCWRACSAEFTAAAITRCTRCPNRSRGGFR